MGKAVKILLGFIIVFAILALIWYFYTKYNNNDNEESFDEMENNEIMNENDNDNENDVPQGEILDKYQKKMIGRNSIYRKKYPGIGCLVYCRYIVAVCEIAFCLFQYNQIKKKKLVARR